MKTIRKYSILLFVGILGITAFSCSDFWIRDPVHN